MRAQPLELVLFETDPVRASAAQVQGVRSFLFDVERRGKTERQLSFDTQISKATLDQLSAFVAKSNVRPTCRLDAPHSGTPSDVEQAIEGGASELIFPMVRTAAEVERLISLVGGRVSVGIMVETKDILDCLPDIARLPLNRIYVGLNDVMIARGGRNLFEPMIDGTADRIREQIGTLRLGLAAATRVDGGSPVPFRLLLADMARLGVDFTILRRSFRRDVKLDEIGEAIRGISKLWLDLRGRTEAEIARDRASFVSVVTRLGANTTA